MVVVVAEVSTTVHFAESLVYSSVDTGNAGNRQLLSSPLLSLEAVEVAVEEEHTIVGLEAKQSTLAVVAVVAVDVE